MKLKMKSEGKGRKHVRSPHKRMNIQFSNYRLCSVLDQLELLKFFQLRHWRNEASLRGLARSITKFTVSKPFAQTDV